MRTYVRYVSFVSLANITRHRILRTFVWNDLHRKCYSVFGVKEMTRYHDAECMVKYLAKDEGTDEARVSVKSLIKTGQRDKETRHAKGRCNRNKVNKSVGEVAHVMRKYDVFLSFNFADKDPRGFRSRRSNPKEAALPSWDIIFFICLF